MGVIETYNYEEKKRSSARYLRKKTGGKIEDNLRILAR